MTDAERRAPLVSPCVCWRALSTLTEGVVNVSFSIDSIAPTHIQENEPFKVTWTLTVGENFEARSVIVTLLTDDARLVLLDPKSQESPPEAPVAVTPGQKISRTVHVAVQRRKGLIDEAPRDANSSPFYVLGRVRHDTDVLAASGGIEVEMSGLTRRSLHRIFL